MLKDIFAKQKLLQSNLGFNFDTMSDKERVDYIKEYSIHTTQELHELLRELPYFKPWSVRSNSLSIKARKEAFIAARLEYADFFHFAINIALGLGLSAEDLFKIYATKNEINHKRQKHGY